nr:MAG TPA: minor tail protein [Caudoviricetes sp.]
MSEGTSVGKIFLELDILSDLKSQLENIASKAQGQAKNSFESVGKAASEAIQKPIEKVGNTVEKVADNVQKTTEECITAAGESLDAMVERALKPRNFEVEAKVTQAAAEPGAPRGPPKYAMAGPDPAKFIENYGKQAEKSTIPMEDIFQAADKPAELLKQKIENITTQITDQRENLLKLENAYAKLGEEGGEESDKLAQKITAGEGRLISLQQTLMQTQAKYDKAMSAAAQATEKPKEAVDSLGEQIKSTLKSAASKGGKSVKNGLGKAFSSMKQNASKSVKDVGHKVSGLGRSIKSAFKSAVLMAGLYAAFRAFRDLVGGALTSNEQFAASLNALKGNLQVAFTPILQVIMPAVNALMSGLAAAAQKIAAFTSAVFGKTYAQSVAATKRLKSTSKEAKKAAGAVAGFDQLNNIEKSESEDAGGTNLDTLAVGPNAGANMVKEFSDLGPIIAGFLTQALVKIAEFAPKFVQGAVQVLTSFIRGINANFPMISSAVLGIITAFMDGLDQLIPELVPFGVNVITLLVQAFLTYAPRLISAGIALITGLLAGLADKMPELFPMAQDAIRMIVKSLTDNLPQILQSGMEILLALIDGIIEMIPELMPAIVLVVMQIVQALVDNLPHIIQSGINLILALIKGITGSLGVILQHAPEIIESLVKGLVEAIPILLQGAWELVKALSDYLTSVNWAQLGIDIMVALANGIIKGINSLISKLNLFDIDVPDWVPVIGGKNISFKLPTISTIKAPQLPSFASGGIVSQPTLAMVGDNRQSAEAIAPLHELYGMIKQAVADGGTGLTAGEIYTAMLNALNDSKFGSQIRLEGDVNIDGRKFARIIAQAVWDEFVRMGKLKPRTI